MKKILLYILITGISFNLFGQLSSNKSQKSKNSWLLQINLSLGNTNIAGIEPSSDGYFGYAPGLHLFWELDTSAQVLNGFQIPNVWYLRELTTDGQYYYASCYNQPEIYKLDLESATPANLGTLSIPFNAVHVCYDPTANNNAGGLWYGGANTGIFLMDMNGNLLDSIPYANLAFSDIAGSAVDNYSPGGPYLWLINANANQSTTLTRIHIPTKLPSGISKNLEGIICNPGDIGGGLFITENLIPGTVTLGGTIKGETIFGFDLSTTASDSLDLDNLGFTNIEYLAADEAVILEGSIKNNGFALIENFNINYDVDGDTIAYNINNLSLNQFDLYNFIDTIDISTVAGGNTVKVWTDSPNGGIDESPTNDDAEENFSIYNLDLEYIIMAEFHPDTTDVEFMIGFRNIGIETINSYKIFYSVDNADTVLMNYSNVSIATDSLVTHSYSLTASLGNHALKVWTAFPNGFDDQITTNDSRSFEYTVYDAALAVPRIPIFEVFTSSTCAPCAGGNAQLQSVLDTTDISTWTCIKYQMDWPGAGDPYYTSEGGIKSNFYGISGVPYMHVNGDVGYSPFSFSPQRFSNSQAVPSFIEMDANYSVSGQSVQVHVELTPTKDFIAGSYRLFMAVIENETFNNVGTNGETHFEFVMKKMLPNANGTIVTNLIAGSTLTFDENYEFQGSYRLPSGANDQINHAIEHSVEEFSDLSVVVWLQDITTKTVFQSAWATLITNQGEQSQDEGLIVLFPNPATDEIFMQYLTDINSEHQISIYDLHGKKVKQLAMDNQISSSHIKVINVNDLPEGIYLFQCISKNHMITKKIIIESSQKR